MLDVTKLLCRTEDTAAELRERGGVGHGDRFAGLKRPVVVWNVTRQCNLHCQHCYASAGTKSHPEELSAEEGRALVAELGRCKVPALIFSGGDPLLRHGLLDLVRLASSLGIHPAISTNGTLIDATTAERMKGAGVAYVGVSIDGIGARHDR